MSIRTKILLSLLASGTLMSGVSANTDNSESTTNYEEKLPYKFKDPAWEKYNNGDEGLWPRPPLTSYTSGIVSGAANNAFDYKEKYNNFFSMVEKYKIDGPVESYYKSNDTSPVTMSIPQGSSQGKTVGGDVTLDFTFFGGNLVPAYNGIKSSNELFLDSASGQWLVTNHIYSRDNTAGITSSGLTTITSSSLGMVPWGDGGVSTYITPEDFLMGLSKAVYGVEESRPMYLQTEPYRLAKKNTWWVYRPPAEPDEPCPIIWRYETGEWKNQDVSYINPAWTDYTPPSACGQGKRMDWGEYVVNVDGTFGNLWHRYYKDQNSYVSANVYELYFTRLLQKGILQTDTAFANVSNNILVKRDKEDAKAVANSFSFTTSFGERFLAEYINYGYSAGEKAKTKYPVWAPELEALYSNLLLQKTTFGDPAVNKAVELITHGGNMYSNALGVGYKVEGNSSQGVTSIQKNENPQIMVKRSVTLIDALRVVERAMRVEDGDMTKTEAEIITRKYGAQYLDDLSEQDRKTVSYLLAKGILNFENHQEYSNLYSPLTNSFGYKLLYRIANEESRLKFNEVMLTDSSEIPSLFFSYKQKFTTIDINKAASVGSISEKGELIKNASGERLIVTSDIQFSNKSTIIKAKEGSPVQDRHVITAEIDDPLKYLYRGMPLVNVDETGAPFREGNSLKVYVSAEKKIYNNIDESVGRYVGIKSITYVPATKRYKMVFYVYGTDYSTAVQFIKANLETRLASISTQETSSGVKSQSGANLNMKATSQVATEIKNNNDIKTNTEVGATAYTGDKATIAGNNIVVGEAAAKVDSTNLTSIDIIDKLSQKADYETIGQKNLVALPTSQLRKATSYPILTQAGRQLGKASVIQEKVTSAESTKGLGDIELDVVGINISQNESSDTLIYDTKFTFTVIEGDEEQEKKDPNAKKTRKEEEEEKAKIKEREITGSIVLSWELDLPNSIEQLSMAGSSVSPTINDNAKASWIFTKPTNKDLLSIWNYNEGLNNAILKTISKEDMKIKSGYFAPKITILVDSLNKRQITHEGKVENRDLTELQLAEIQNSFLKHVGKNLDSGWIQTYIGNASLANYIVGNETSNSAITKYITKNNLKDEVTPSLTIKPDSKYLREVTIPKGIPVWAGLVFGQERDTSAAATYFTTHAHKTDFQLETIYTISNGYKFYGEYSHRSGEGISPYLNIPYIRDEFGNIYLNQDDSDYRFNTERKALIQNDETGGAVRTGSVVAFKDVKYTVQSDTSNYYNLYSHSALTAIVKNGELYLKDDVGSNTKITDAVIAYNNKVFGTMSEPGINGNHYQRTQAFTFLPSEDILTPGTKFIGVTGGKMVTYEYKIAPRPDGSTGYYVEPTASNEGDLVYVTPYVTLSKHVWYIEGSNLKWGKRFLGADPAMYIKGTLVQSLKEQILPEDSKNIVEASKVKEGTLNIGNITGKLNGDKATFLVPYNSAMVVDGKIVNDAVVQKFDEQGDLVLLPSNGTASSTQFITKKEVGAYDATFTGYKNTLVNNKGKLQVATGTTLVDYTSSSVIDTISLTGIIMDGVRFLNYGPSGGEGVYKIYQYQEVRPPNTVAPFTDGAPPVPNTSGTQILDVASAFEGLSTANELFDSLQKELRRLWVENMWLFIVYTILGLCLFLSVTTLLAHVFAHTPISNVFFSRMYDVISIDVLALMSVGTVRITEEESNNWIKTVKTSFILGVFPIMIFGLLQIFKLI